MTWTRLPDDFTDRPDVLRLSRSARLLHVEALVWCNRLLTNGVIRQTVLRRISDSDDLDADVAELAKAGLWTRLEDAWQVDWSDQETKEAVDQRREDRNARQRRYNERQRRHANHDHSMCDPRHCPALLNASRNASRNASDDAYPTRPVPSRPEGEGQGQGGEGGSASSDSSAALRRSSSPPPPGEPRPGVLGPPPGAENITVNGVPVIGPGSWTEREHRRAEK